MLFDLYDIPFEAQAVYPLFGGVLGVLFGALALLTRFCLRQAVTGESAQGMAAKSVWATAFIAAVLGNLALEYVGFIELSEHRLFAPNLPILALFLGGGLFGIGMVLTRGCVSRATILLGTGNLRSLFVLLIFAITAHATLKGVLAPLRVLIGAIQIDLSVTSLGDLPGGPIFWALMLCGAATFWLISNFPSKSVFVAAIGLGLLVPIGWAGTSVLLNDPFDPLPAQSFAFTLPWSELLFWAIASSAITAGFGPGMVAGVLLGSFFAAGVTGQIKLRGFDKTSDMPRYLLGSVLMGFGGVLAGGCSVGAGLSGVSNLSIAALLALAAMIFGARVTAKLLERTPGLPAIA